MTCHDLDERLPRYAAGQLPEGEALALERHAASCARCAERLDTLPSPNAAAYMPLPLAALRQATLHAVAARVAARRRARWLTGVTALAAAALAAFWIVPRGTPDRPDRVVTASIDAGVARDVDPSELAAALARTEFTALDEAAKELQAAIDDAPADRQLQAFLASVAAQRAALERRVKDAAT